MEKRTKTGLFFGSFNPIHCGHLVIAEYMAEHTDIREVWFVVSPHNPLKPKASLLADYHRLEMVNLAIGEDPRFRACDAEFRLPQPSYTVDTLAFLRDKYPVREFAIIAGTDILPEFHLWKNYEKLLEAVDFYIYPRPGTDTDRFDGHPHLKRIGAPLIGISSSLIRESLKAGKAVRYMLPPAVYTYLTEMHFYGN